MHKYKRTRILTPIIEVFHELLIYRFIDNIAYSIFFQLLSFNLSRKSMFCKTAFHFKSGLLHLIGQTNSQKDRRAKVKEGIISKAKFLGTISVDQYISLS
jgi:hypothetical protein